MSSEPLPRREQDALYDLANWRGRYVFKQASMRKLEAKGLVCKTGTYYGKTVWTLTQEGRNHG